MRSGMFEPQTTPEQQAALARLETLLALIEGWVDAVVADAVGRAPAGRRGAARDAAPPPRFRRAGRADVRHDRRARAAAAPAARGRRAVAAAGRAARHRRARRAVGAPGPDPVGRRPRRPGRRSSRREEAGDPIAELERQMRGGGPTADGAKGDDGRADPARRRRAEELTRGPDASGSAGGRRRARRPGWSAGSSPSVPHQAQPGARPRRALQVADRALGARVAAHPRPERGRRGPGSSRCASSCTARSRPPSPGASRSRSLTRIVPSAGVHEAQRVRIGGTQRTLVGLGAALEVAAGQLDAAPAQRVVVPGARRRPAAGLAALQPAHHLVDPAASPPTRSSSRG